MNINYAQMNDEKEISLLNLCFSILKKWKLMIAAAVIVAVLAGGFTYFKSYTAYKASQNVTETKTVEDVELTEKEKAALDAKIALIEENKEIIAEYDYYLENSIKANLNPNGFFEGKVNYIVSADSHEAMLKALTHCKTKAFKEENFEVLAGKLTEDSDAALLKEVVLSEEERYEAQLLTDSIAKHEVAVACTLTVQHYNQDDCEKMLAFFEKEIDEAFESLESENIAASVTKMASDIYTTNDREIVTLSHDIKTARNAAYDNIAILENSMTEAQKEYYALTWNLAGEEEVKEELPTVSKPSLDVKMIVVGAIAGAFLIACCYGVLYLFDGCVHTKEEVESWLNVPVLGYEPESGKKINVVDKMLLKAEKSMRGSGQDTIEMIATMLGNLTEKNGTKKLFLTGSISNTDAILKLKALLEPEVDVVAGNNILSDVKAFQEAVDCGAVAFVEKCGVSKEKDIREEIAKVASCGAKVLSVILEK